MTTETNAERLESAKRLITAVREANSVDDPEKFWSSLLDLFGFGYLDLLLQQVERAQELEKDRNRLELRCGNLVEGIQLRDEENARLREAIKQSLEAHKWNNEESAQILEKALKGESE